MSLAVNEYELPFPVFMTLVSAEAFVDAVALSILGEVLEPDYFISKDKAILASPLNLLARFLIFS